MKVVFIGAASPQWGFGIARDFIVTLSDEKITSVCRPHFVLEDIDGVNLGPITALARQVAAMCGDRVTVEGTTDQPKALEGANFAVVSIAAGSLEAMQHDLDIPREYGIYQPVGDTISIGGAVRACRNIPAMLSIARDMEKLAAPGAWLLNLTNPMSILCRAVTRETRVNTVGLCHELYGGLHLLSRWLGFDYSAWRTELDFGVLGINHCGWMPLLKIGDRDGLKLLREFLANQGITAETRQLYNSPAPELARENVKIDLFLRHGAFPYSGDRHTSEFFTEFLNRDTNQGADFGVLLTTPQERLVAWRGNARARTKAMLAGQEEIKLDVSQEAASRIVRAMVLDEPFGDVSNLPYTDGKLPGVPAGAVLERLAVYRKNSAVPRPAPTLPPAVHAHMVNIALEIEDIVEAAVTGSRKKLLAALERDQLLKNMPAAKVPEMVDRLLAVHKPLVHPGFF